MVEIEPHVKRARIEPVRLKCDRTFPKGATDKVQLDYLCQTLLSAATEWLDGDWPIDGLSQVIDEILGVIVSTALRQNFASGPINWGGSWLNIFRVQMETAIKNRNEWKQLQSKLEEIAKTQAQDAAKHGARLGRPEDCDRHRIIAEIVRPFGDDWKKQANLEKIVTKIAKRKLKPPRDWATRTPPARSWTRAVEEHADLVRKTISYSLKRAAKN